MIHRLWSSDPAPTGKPSAMVLLGFSPLALLAWWFQPWTAGGPSGEHAPTLFAIEDVAHLRTRKTENGLRIWCKPADVLETMRTVGRMEEKACYAVGRSRMLLVDPNEWRAHLCRSRTATPAMVRAVVEANIEVPVMESKQRGHILDAIGVGLFAAERWGLYTIRRNERALAEKAGQREARSQKKSLLKGAPPHLQRAIQEAQRLPR